MPTEQVTLGTLDGDCRAFVMTPGGKGPWPAVIFYGDAGGIRPAMLEMAERLADGGHVVLLPDLFYRYGPYSPLVPKEVFKGDVMAILGPLMATTGTDKASRDTGAFLAYLDTRKDVSGGKIGAVGFCMGGGIAIADNDRSYPPSMAARLEQALAEAGVDYSAETYHGAADGWMVPDFPVYDEEAADRGWKAMLALFDRTLRA